MNSSQQCWVMPAGYFLVLLLSFATIRQATAQGADAALESLRLPVGTSVSWVGKNVLHNGLLLAIQRFRSNHNVAGVLQFYRELWSVNNTGDAPGYQEQSIGNWTVISTLDQGYAIALQLRPGLQNVTQGYVSALGLLTLDKGTHYQAQKLPTDLALPVGTSIVSSTSSTDPIKPGVTLIAENTLPVTQNTRFFKYRLARLGWRLSTSAINGNQAVLMFDKAGSYCEISVSKTSVGSTLLLINRVGNDS